MARKTGWADRRRISKALGQEAWQIFSENDVLKQYAWRAFWYSALLGIGTVIVSGAIAGALAYFAGWLGIVGVVPLFFGIWLTSYIFYLYYGALTAETANILDGYPADYERGLATARDHKKALSRWALIQVIIGFILSAIRESAGDNAIAAIIALIVTVVVGIIWAVISFFVLPLIIFESLGAGQAIKRSKDLARNQWGKQIRGTVRIAVRGTLVYTLPGVLAIIVGIVLIMFGVGAASAAATLGAIVVGAVLLFGGIVLMILGSVKIAAARYIFGVALYRFTVGEGTLGGFNTDDLAASVRVKT